MTQQDIEELTKECSKYTELFESAKPVSANGTFNQEAVKSTILKMIELAFNDEAKAFSLKNWMESHEFFTSPASAKYHANVPGGLAAHSLMVTYQSFKFAPALFSNFALTKRAAGYNFSACDIFIAGIAHDFCKAAFYATEHRKTKNYQGNWVYEPYYKIKQESRNLGHGNESVLMLLETLPEYLQKRAVLEAISRHMGFSDLSPNETYNYSNFLQNPLVLLLQLADQSAAQWWDC